MISPATRTVLLAILLVSTLTAASAAAEPNDPDVPKRHNEATVAQLQEEMTSGRLTSVELTSEYIARIVALDQNGAGVNAVIELNPDALDMARHADQLRRHGIVLGPLHGIPVLLKDNSTLATRCIPLPARLLCWESQLCKIPRWPLTYARAAR
jgi:amidase